MPHKIITYQAHDFVLNVAKAHKPILRTSLPFQLTCAGFARFVQSKPASFVCKSPLSPFKRRSNLHYSAVSILFQRFCIIQSADTSFGISPRNPNKINQSFDLSSLRRMPCNQVASASFQLSTISLRSGPLTSQTKTIRPLTMLTHQRVQCISFKL